MSTMAFKALGNDGLWHLWDDLSEKERQGWMEAMTEADRRHKAQCRPATLRERVLEYENTHRINNWK